MEIQKLRGHVFGAPWSVMLNMLPTNLAAMVRYSGPIVRSRVKEIEAVERALGRQRSSSSKV